jgi:hypothetical protein
VERDPATSQDPSATLATSQRDDAIRQACGSQVQQELA